MRLHLKNARLIDGTGRPVQAAAALIIEGDTIVHAGPLSPADAPREDAPVIDLAGRVVVVDGDPLRDISALQDRQRLSVMKGGRFATRRFS